MARPIRIEYAGAWYHITCRGNERREVFTDDEDRKKFLEMLAQNTELYHAELHAYVLMPNHFHLIIKTHEANLHSFMQRFNTSYTVYFNRKYRRSGHLYQGRYKAILIDADEYLLELSRYVYLNPVRIEEYTQRSVVEREEIIRQYQWSSYPGYVQLSKRQGFVQYGMILGMLGGRDDAQVRRQYERFIMDGILRDMRISFWEGVRGQVALGGERFVEMIYERYLKKRKRDRREQSGLEKLDAKRLTVEEIVNEVASTYHTAARELYQKRSSQAEARSMVIELCRTCLSRKMNMSALGEQLGGISVSAISQNSRRLKEKIRKDKRLQRKYYDLMKGINGE